MFLSGIAEGFEVHGQDFVQTELLLVFAAPGIEEEGLLLDDTGQTPAVVNLPPQERPAEPPSTELPDDLTLPEPPVQVEASGSGTDDLEDPHQPTPAAAEEDIPPEESEPVTEEVLTAAAGVETTDTEALGEDPTAAQDAGSPVLLQPPEAVDVVSEASEPDVAEIAHLPVEEDSPEETPEDSNLPDVPPVDEDDIQMNVILPSENVEEPVFEEDVEETTEAEEDTEARELPAVVNEATDPRVISTEDLMEDNILLVTKEELDSVTPTQPSTRAPEEPPFTRVNVASEGGLDIIIPSVVEVKLGVNVNAACSCLAIYQWRLLCRPPDSDH